MTSELSFVHSFSTVLVLGSRFMALLNCFCHTTPVAGLEGKGASHHVAAAAAAVAVVVVVTVADFQL